MTSLTYSELVRELFPRLTGGIRWGTEKTARLLAAAGDPHRRFRSVHIGGTNGKGSVSATIASVFRAAGRRTGLYTSPHLCTFRERIQVDGHPLPECALVDVARALWPLIQLEEPSFFEATTAIAFHAFAEAGVAVAAVEVGLGGRLDATNVIEPEVAVITNIARDHAEYLGDTIAEIAWEKAGIIKAGVPAVTAERDPRALAVLRARAAEVGAPLYVLDPAAIRDVRVDATGTRLVLRTEAWGELELHTPLIGEHQARNAAVAVSALERLPCDLRPDRDAVVRGVAAVRWPGRLQRERIGGQSWIFDAAHNPAGVEALVGALRTLGPPRPVIVLAGILSDKDWPAMLAPLLDFADALVLTVPPTAPEHRRWDPTAAAASLRSDRVVGIHDFDRALADARARAGAGTVVVSGSFHTVGDALAALDLAPFGVDAPLPALVRGL
ncbi:MAG TPA: folylpolyglutamate synthase/dihydrofolate synthase family protein [Longimicrobiales bacterium]